MITVKDRIKIKANQSFYRTVLIMFVCIIIFGESLGYFLGFDINVKSLMFYAIFLISTFILFYILFLIIDILNKKYIIFDEEKIIEKKKDKEKILVYYNQIVSTKYHNKIDLLDSAIDFGYVKIDYRIDSKDREPKFVCLYLSKKNYKKIFNE